MIPKKVSAIIFDLEGVLFEENRSAFVQKVGFATLARYTLCNWSTPESACLDTLHKISTQEPDQPKIPLINRGRHMPMCIIDWQLGKITHEEVRKELALKINSLGEKKYFKNEEEKKLAQRIIDISIDPLHLKDIAKPVLSMIDLVTMLKRKGYKLYILSNLAIEPYNILKHNYPSIAKLFDDIIISAHVKMLKPHQEIYIHILQKHGLKAEDCIFIDNQKENIESAQQLGIKSIFHKTPHLTKSQLAKLLVL